MRRVLWLWFPTFSTDMVKRRLARRRSQEGHPPECSPPGSRSASPADRRPPRLAILLTTRIGARELVARRCGLSAKAGVAEGMDLSHARSLLPAAALVHVEEYRPDRDSADLHALACWALRFSPIVAPDPPDGIAIDTTGTERLNRGEVRLLRGAAGAIARLGLNARIAAASTLGCARGVAKFGVHDLSRVPNDKEREALAPLPVEALGIEPDMAAGLEEIGITTVRHVLDLSRAAIAARFEPALLDRLDKALGRLPEHVEPVRQTPPIRAELDFDGPTDRLDSIEAAARQVLGDLAAQLTHKERGVRRLDIALRRPHAPCEQVRIVLSRPSRSAAHLWMLVRSRLEQVDLTDGVEGLAFTASRTARLRHEQAVSRALGGDARREMAAAAWGELVDTLVNRLGPERVVRIETVESHLPERAFRERSVLEEPSREIAAVTPADRPTILLRTPEPADVIALTPDGPLMSLRWRGRQQQVIACIGPERIGPEWWRAEQGAIASSRDYFAVQVESGRWLWVCRLIDSGGWCVHGEWS